MTKRGIRNSVLERIAANQKRVVDAREREEQERAAIRELAQSGKTQQEKRI